VLLAIPGDTEILGPARPPVLGRRPRAEGYRAPLISRVSWSTWQNRVGWAGHMPRSADFGQQAAAVSW